MPGLKEIVMRSCDEEGVFLGSCPALLDRLGYAVLIAGVWGSTEHLVYLHTRVTFNVLSRTRL